MYSGPKIVQGDLTFGYDTGRNPSSTFDERLQKRRHFKGAPTVNFFPDGHFPNGTDMASEAGSNSQNDIVLLKNPGDSPYVLRQSMGVAYTEYQINLTTQLTANTTYCMSGWYAESNNYSGSSRMFHARAHSSSGSHISTGAGVYNVIKTKRVGGLLWKFAFYTITTPSDYSNNFNWYVGYLNQSYTGYRYYTNLKLEQGTRPTPYHAGTRSSTNSLIDLKKSKTLDLANVSFDSDGLVDFDGTDDHLIIEGVGIGNYSEAFSYECVFKAEGTWANGYISNIVGNAGSYAGFYGLGKSGTNTIQFVIRDANYNAISGTVSNVSTYHHLVGVWDQSNSQMRLYIDGTLVSSASSITKTGAPDTTNLYIGGRRAFGGSNGSWYDGVIPVVKYYKTALTTAEVKQNFLAYRRRFNI